MAVQQFRRAFKVQIGEVSFDSTPARPLTFKFKIERDLDKTPNNATIQVYNLSEDNRALLSASKFVACKIDAGYEDGLSQLFLGDLRRAKSVKQGPDWITILDSGDGEKSITQNKISRTFAKGTSLVEVLNALTTAVGLGTGNVGFTSAVSYKNGRSNLAAPWSAVGNAGDELEFFTRSVGLQWSAQDGQLIVTPEGQPAYDTGPLISPETGLVGAASLDSDGKVQLRALLLPDVIPGHTFQLESENISGKFQVTHTVHNGDSTGQPWYVDITGTQLT